MKAMQNWFQQLRQKFEHKPTPEKIEVDLKSEEIQKETHIGRVKEVKDIFENLSKDKVTSVKAPHSSPVSIQSNKIKSKQSPVSSKPKPLIKTPKPDIEGLKNRNKSIDSTDEDLISFPKGIDKKNLDLDPSEVTNGDDVCIYSDFGSFKRRPKYNYGENFLFGDNDVLMRQKAEEKTCNDMKRYESILNPSMLFQQKIVLDAVITTTAAAAAANDGTGGESEGASVGIRRQSHGDKLRKTSVFELIHKFNKQNGSKLNVGAGGRENMDRELMKVMNSQRLRDSSHSHRGHSAVCGGGGEGEGEASNGHSGHDGCCEDDNDDDDDDDVNHNIGILTHLINNAKGEYSGSDDDDDNDSDEVHAKFPSIPRWLFTDQVSRCNLNLSDDQIEYHELQFELIISEATYHRSLTVLIDVFYRAPELSTTNHSASSPTSDWIIKPLQKEHLFSSITKIYEMSSKFLADLESDFSQDIFMSRMYNIISQYAENQFEVYVPYLRNQKFQTLAYNELKKDPRARQVLETLENKSECCKLSLDSFLLLPMQRLLRLRLLLEKLKQKLAVLQKDASELNKCLRLLEAVIDRCSNDAVIMEEREQMAKLMVRLQFKPNQSTPALASGRLIIEGSLKRSSKKTSNILILTSYSEIYFILTNEYLVMAKQSNSSTLLVDDFCPLHELQLDPSSSVDSSDTTFKIIITPSTPPLPPPPYFYLVQAKTSKEAKLWTKYIRENKEQDN